MVPAEPSASPSRRRIVLTTFGSLGDLHPYIAVALGLKARGHEAVIATSGAYWQKVETLGIGFRAVRPDHPDPETGADLMRRSMDRRTEGEVELVQFGLMPEFIGQGLGRYFLQWTIDRAWSYGPRRFWLHTDTKDHPAALPNYLKAGLAVSKEEMKG